jgi:DNA polymerase-4
MPLRKAQRLCPEGIFLPVDMDKYAAVSRQLHSILSSYTPLVEPVSIDEAYLDVTASERLYGGAEKIGREIKQRVLAELNLTVSVGIAPNKFLAKIASDLEKPDGFVVVRQGTEIEFLRDLPVSKIPGVGKVTTRRMAGLGIGTIGQLAEKSRIELRRLFGASGERLHELSHGIDTSEVVAEAQAKSISHETTFEQDVADVEYLRKTFSMLADRVSARLREEQLTARTIGIKVRLADFTTMHRERTLSEPTDADAHIFSLAWDLFQKVPLGGQKIRLIGVEASDLNQPSGQLHLFTDGGDRARKALTTIDNIRRKFGDEAIGRASHIGGKKEPEEEDDDTELEGS